MSELRHSQVLARIQESVRLLSSLGPEQAECIVKAAECMAYALAEGGAVLLCGNGGSAAQCQHIAAELVGRMAPQQHHRPYRAIALTADTAVLTALGNDYGIEQIFRRQVEALGRSGDVLLALSTSGDSPNVLQAMQAARTMGMSSVAMLGRGGRAALLADVAIMAPGETTPHIQEAHLVIGHILCELVDLMLSDSSGAG